MTSAYYMRIILLDSLRLTNISYFLLLLLLLLEFISDTTLASLKGKRDDFQRSRSSSSAPVSIQATPLAAM